MSEAKHTPGPWRWAREMDSWWSLVGQDDVEIADDGSAAGEYIGWMKSPDEPNARLIAAAPELLEKLDHLVQCCDALNIVGADIDEARAAIAKATGEAQS